MNISNLALLRELAYLDNATLDYLARHLFYLGHFLCSLRGAFLDTGVDESESVGQVEVVFATRTLGNDILNAGAAVANVEVRLC
jgi:hypothetical protein